MECGPAFIMGHVHIHIQHSHRNAAANARFTVEVGPPQQTALGGSGMALTLSCLRVHAVL